MDIRQLRYFTVLAEELHFRRAAERLHIAQPALSQQIRRLEAELGLRLLDRKGRRVSLTDAGGLLLGEATGVLARFDELAATMARARAGELGMLRIGISPGPLRTILPAALAELRRRAPGVQVATRSMATRDQLTAVLDAALDLALIPSVAGARATPPLVERAVDRRPLGVALAARHPGAGRSRLAAGDLAGMALVWMARAGDPDLYDAVMAALARAGLEPHSLLESSSPDSSLGIVSAGLAFSVKTREEVEQARDGGEHVVWRPLAGFDVDLSTLAVWHAERPTAPLRAFLDILEQR